MSEVYSASAGGVQVLHALATSDHALTAGELSERLPGADEGTVQSTVSKLYRGGFVVRRKRDCGTAGPNPWEYELYQPEGDSA